MRPDGLPAFCQHCGAALSDPGAFCQHCGGHLASVTAPPPPIPRDVPPESTSAISPAQWSEIVGTGFFLFLFLTPWGHSLLHNTLDKWLQ